jgi:hypothetical protein
MSDELRVGMDTNRLVLETEIQKVAEPFCNPWSDRSSLPLPVAFFYGKIVLRFAPS